MQGAASELTREIADAGRSLIRLGRFDPIWHEGLDISAGGFIRSFFAPLFALPFHLVFAALVTTGGGAQPISTRALVALTVAHLINAFGYPVLVALAARPFGFQAGYAPFIILMNWACLFFNMALCAIAPLSLLGGGGFDIMRLVWMLLFGLRVFVTWRSARNTLSNDFAPALLMIVGLVATDLVADRIGALVVGIAG